MAWPWGSKFPALQEACCRGLQPCRLLISVPKLAFNIIKQKTASRRKLQSSWARLTTRLPLSGSASATRRPSRLCT